MEKNTMPRKTLIVSHAMKRRQLKRVIYNKEKRKQMNPRHKKTILDYCLIPNKSRKKRP